jgi:hypothetical protein
MRRMTVPILRACRVSTALAVAFALAPAAAGGEADGPRVALVVLPEGAGTLTTQVVGSQAPPAVCEVGVPVTEASLPDACSARHPEGTRVTVTAVPDPAVPGSSFDRWSDYRCPDEPSCTVTLTEDRSLVGLFDTVYLKVRAGTFGPITLSPPGTVCTFMPDALTGENEPCLGAYERGSDVTLERDPDAATALSEWSGACSGAATTCELELSANAYVRAGTAKSVATPSPYTTFTLRRRGSGGTIVASKGQPRSCKSKSCDLSGLRGGDDVRLVAKSTTHWKFVRWENNSHNATRPVTVGNLTAAEAVFAKKKPKKKKK